MVKFDDYLHCSAKTHYVNEIGRRKLAQLDQLPAQFLTLHDKIASTVTSCIEFDLQAHTDDIDVKPWHSNLGIFPYLPCGMDYPKSKTTNEPLQFLAQINFAEMPKLADFPEQGVVQFYLNMKQMDLGVDEDLEHVQINHRVVYCADVIESLDHLQDTDTLKALSDMDEDETELWVTPSRWVNVSAVEQYITFFDYRFAPLLFGREEVAVSANHEDLIEAYEQYQIPYTEQFQIEGGHRIGGYANYLHATDNRTRMGIEDYLLLLQLDTDDGLEWCDGGIAQWYIHPDDLKHKNFSKVVFLWACH